MPKVFKVACRLMAMVACMPALAVEISQEQAQTAVRNWIRKNPCPMTAQFATCEGTAQPFTKGGKALFHVVQLEGGGFVVTSGDTRISPIIAFSDSGEFHPGEDNPLVPLLEQALMSRFDKAYPPSDQETSVSGKGRLLSAVSPSDGQDNECLLAEKAWGELLSEPGGMRTARLLAVSSQSAISDMRVAPIVKTSWGQRYWNGDKPKEAVFNYHTPSCPCGCVATAAAQVMRTMRFPDTAITPQTFTCSMESREEEHRMYGGTYNWDLMPYSVSDVTTLSEAQIKEIGKLTWDIGASVNMNYTSGNSTTGLAQLRSALVDVFGFKSANLLIVDRVYGTVANEVDACVMFASLDAGLPVFGGIFQLTQDNAGKRSTAGGHCVLFDGYGFIGATPYVHMNCGYNGAADVWYAFFKEFLVNGASYKYNYIYQLVYNVDCRAAGDVISGRVLDGSGSPVASAEVSLSDASGRTIATTRSTSRGVWACRVPIGPGTNFVSAATATAASKASRVIRQGTVAPDGSRTVIGNRWGIELLLEDIPLEQVETPKLNPSKGGFSGSYVSVSMTCGTLGATIRYTSDGSEPTVSSARYSSAIRVIGTTTIRARAFKEGMRPSEIATVVYEQNVFKGESDIAAALDCSDSTFAFSSSVSYFFRGKTTYFDSQKVAECVYGQTQETFDGVDAVMLKVRPYSTGFTLMWGATTELSMTVRGPGLLRFKYKQLKDKFPNGFLSCSVNGTEKISGLTESEWTSVVLAVPGTGVNTIAWKAGVYSGASTPSSLNDVKASVVLDDLEWIPGTVAKRSVTYNLNGDESGLSTPAGSTGYPGEKTSVPADAGYVRNGYVFGGWNTEPDGSGVSYWPKASFVFGESDVVLYARWCKIVEVPFDFASEGGVHSFPLKGFAGSKFHGVGTFPAWASYTVTDANGNLFVGGSSFVTLSFTAESTLHVSLGKNPDPEERSFSWGVISETHPEVPMFVCRQHGDMSHILDGLVIDGPESVVAGTSVGLTATAHYRDGTSARVSGCTWGVSSGTAYAGVSSAGILTGKSVTDASVVTVSATYREGDVQISVGKDFIVLPAVALGESLNAEATTFRTGTGSEGWVGQLGVSADGISAARCGSCLNASPWIEFDLPKGRSLSFACRLSEGSGRNLTIYVDGQVVDRFISTVDMSDWLSWEIAAANRARTIRVVYQWHGSKGALAAEGDCAWIDYVNFGDLPQLDELSWGYRIVNGGAIVTNASPHVMGDIVIPGRLGGCPVVAIGSAAFSDRTDITSVVFPQTVTNIGECAFFDCVNLTSVVWPAQLKAIGEIAFYFTGLSNVSLSDGVETIGDGAFEFSFVESASIPRSVRVIGDRAFFGCSYLESVVMPRIKISGDVFESCARTLKITYWDEVLSCGTITCDGEEVVAGGVARVVLHREGGDAGCIAVKVKTQTSTGICGTDFAYVKKVLVWEDGDTTDKVIEIPTYASGAGKSLRVKLATLTTGAYEGCVAPRLAEAKVYAEMLPPNPGRVVVTGPDPLAVTAGEPLHMKFSRVGGSDGSIAVKAKTQTSTALMGVNGSADFDYVKATLEWGDGDTSERSIEIPTYAGPWEGVRMLRVKLATLATGAYAGNLVPALDQAKVYADIESPTAFGTVYLAPDTVNPKAGQTLRLVFRRVGGCDYPIAVKYKVQTSTAIAGVDFAYRKGVIVWDDGEDGDQVVEVPTYPSAAGKQLRVKLSTLTQGDYLGCVTPHVKSAKVYVPIY